jgi:hypothetical protein
MPLSRHRIQDTRKPPADGHGDLNNLRLPQARVLRALMPADPTEPPIEWPLLTRTYLCLRAGFKLTSGSITRVLNGIRPGNTTSGAPHPGLVERALVEEVVLDICGVEEVNYRITAAGIRAYEAYLARGGRLPEVKLAELCTNIRYAKVQGGELLLALVGGKAVADAS